MGKGKDFRPRRGGRGFDDDMPPPPFEMRSERPARSFGGPSPYGSNTPAPAAGPVTEAKVSWFNSEKGFGFAALTDGSGDAFLHIGALQSIGRDTVAPGTTLRVQVSQGVKGKQVAKILEVDDSTAEEAPRRAPSGPRMGGDRGDRGGDRGGFGGGAPRRQVDTSNAVALDGSVKWFNPEKGFGFVAGEDGGKDVFVHISVLQRAGLQGLQDGQRVALKVVETPKGREAVSIETLD